MMLFSFFYASVSIRLQPIVIGDGDGGGFLVPAPQPHQPSVPHYSFQSTPTPTPKPHKWGQCPSRRLEYDHLLDTNGCDGIVGFNIPMNDIAKDWQVTNLASIAGDINTVTNWLNLVKWSKSAIRAFSTFSMGIFGPSNLHLELPYFEQALKDSSRYAELKTTVIKVTKSEGKYYVRARQAAHAANYHVSNLYEKDPYCTCPFKRKERPYLVFGHNYPLFTGDLVNKIYSQVESQISGKIASFLNA